MSVVEVTLVYYISMDNSSYSLRNPLLVLFMFFQEPEPQFKVFVDKLVEDLQSQKLSEPHIIEKKWPAAAFLTEKSHCFTSLNFVKLWVESVSLEHCHLWLLASSLLWGRRWNWQGVFTDSVQLTVKTSGLMGEASIAAKPSWAAVAADHCTENIY